MSSISFGPYIVYVPLVSAETDCCPHLQQINRAAFCKAVVVFGNDSCCREENGPLCVCVHVCMRARLGIYVEAFQWLIGQRCGCKYYKNKYFGWSFCIWEAYSRSRLEVEDTINL